MIVVDRLTDLPTAVAGYPAMTAKDYIMQPRATRRTVPKILNPRAPTATRHTTLLAAGRGARRTRWCPPSRPCSSSPAAPPTSTPWPSWRTRSIAPSAGWPTRRPLRSGSWLPVAGRRCALRPVRPAAVRLVRCPILEVFVKAGESWACASSRHRRSPSWAMPARRSLGPRSRPMSASLEVAARQGPAPVHAGRAARPGGAAPSDLCHVRHFERIAEGAGAR